MRLAFLGTPGFAARILGALIDAGHDVVAAYTQPPRPAGRGHRVMRSPVHELAEVRAIPVETPAKLDDAVAKKFAALNVNAAVVAAYGLILPKTMIDAPRLGCLNVHASLLPRWRGAAPIERALLAGDRETGISIMRMDEGLDTGPVLLAERMAIPARMGASALYDELAALGARLIVAALAAAAEGKLNAKLQSADGVTYAKKLRREEGALDWRRPAAELERAVRAFEIFPGTYFIHNDERIRVLAAETADGSNGAVPGMVLDDQLTIACGAGALQPTRLQRAGRAALRAEDFLRGHAIPRGTVLPCLATS
ncbi:MAG: methionyl-tRNA formyltransferase [Alphaproteobacteria bacterium]|nr:methionyl-tRNA formyltransferase [Alphaproteobacteria bacterium]